MNDKKMMNKHWTSTELLNRVYGAGPQDVEMDRHLDACLDCRAKWEELAAARQHMLRQDEGVSPEFLATQRERIYSRIETRKRSAFFVRWSPALAVAGMALCVVLWKSPAQRSITQPVEVATASDAQLMTDIYKTVYDSEPDVVEPLHGLFESKQQQSKQQ